MFVPFESLPDESRIWIYQADRNLEKHEIDFVNEFLKNYCDKWAAHGNALKASFDVRYDRFVILAVDENYNGTSGCSIDDSVRAVKAIEQKLGIGFFDRQQVAFYLDGSLKVYLLSNLKEKFTTEMLKPATLTFNNLINAKFQLQQEWMVPASSSWLKRYLPAATAQS